MLKTLIRRELHRHGYVVGQDMPKLGRPRLVPVHEDEYVRLATFELCAHEITTKHVPGDIAELGVYQGDFAKVLNRAFPDRVLYLFDTFDGFDARDIAGDQTRGYSDGSGDFRTSVQIVLDKMPFPDQCRIQGGWFPDTAAGIEGPFAFVSLDADLYDPLLAGLQFFYPRLNPGGFVFVHDYNNAGYGGARKAVEHFAATTGVRYVPIPDRSGTVIFTK